jgi:uncharacterized protein
MIKDQSSLSSGGDHGLDHWVRVLNNGRKLAKQTGANLKIVELFAVFHDSRRLNESCDPEHGLRGGQFASEMCGTWFEISDGEMELLFNACELHTNGLTESDITIQTCWDSDRLDLGRVGITPDPRYLCTDAAKSDEMVEWAHYKRLGRF